jgi:peptide/nickel transport system permease protein
MRSGLLRRLLSLPLLAFAAATAVFFLVTIVPGDPAVARLGEGASAADLGNLRASLGLDRPLGERYFRFVSGLARGDFGRSWHSGRPNLEQIVERFPATAELAVAAILFALLGAVPLATLAAIRRGTSLDRLLRFAAGLGVAAPSYAVGPVLILLFGVLLGILPVAGRRDPASWILPAATLALPLAASLFRILRAGLEEEAEAPWLRAAQARGAGPFRLVGRHALANALLPATSWLGLQLGSLLTGALVTETLFAWPGIGRLLVESIRRRDWPLLEATVFFFALVWLLASLAVDLLVERLDPRTRGESA